ncbi:sigma-E factor regulatory protein RseB domain-containing protein [Thermocatellispora tengchongensis]
MLDVLARNYDIVTAGGGTVCGRSARIVLALRDDGTTAARFWLDDATRLVLRREIMDAHGRVSRDDAFTDVAIPHPHLPAATARSGVLATPAGPAAEVPDAATLDTLRRHGWRFAETLPGRFELFTAGEMEGDRTTGPYVYLGYSDGLSVVSVFIQPGHLDEEHLTGWHAHVRAGHTIWTRDSSGQAQGQEAIWASGGQVYTVLADAPAEVVDAAIAAFPHEREPGLWARMALGAARLLAWVNPFGE